MHVWGNMIFWWFRSGRYKITPFIMKLPMVHPLSLSQQFSHKLLFCYLLGIRILGAMTSHLGQIVHLVKKCVRTRKCTFSLQLLSLGNLHYWFSFRRFLYFVFDQGYFSSLNTVLSQLLQIFIVHDYKHKLSGDVFQVGFWKHQVFMQLCVQKCYTRKHFRRWQFD